MMRSAVPRTTRGLRSVRAMDSYTRHVHAATPVNAKSVRDKVSEVAKKKVNKKVGEGLASAIETGEKATEKTKQTLGASTKSAKQRAAEAKQTAHETGEQAEQRVEEVCDAYSRVNETSQSAGKASARTREAKENVKKDL
ncbi:hypothetical protein BU15DRAFT_71883 [Melanogaster broomeanus]|nr:hypothetical protein BU15DRAFT_71883 [Melanogaster broomeanus]